MVKSRQFLIILLSLIKNKLGHIFKDYLKKQNKSADCSSKIIQWDQQGKPTSYMFTMPHTSKGVNVFSSFTQA